VLDAPLGKLSPTVDAHRLRSYHDLVKFMGDRVAAGLVSIGIITFIYCYSGEKVNSTNLKSEGLSLFTVHGIPIANISG
jgi:hypothetical protein